MMEKSPNVRMYQNPVLHALSISGPKMMIVFHLSAIICVLTLGYRNFYYFNSFYAPLFLFIGGMLTWTLTEYLMHRYVFHFETDNKIIKAIHFAMHGHHHEHPRDSNHLFMPPVPATLLLLAFFGIFYAIMRTNAWFFMPGFELGYLLYSCMHYRIHTGNTPKRFMKLWHHHIVHHYKQPERAFGVSTRIWDRVFKTMPVEDK